MRRKNQDVTAGALKFTGNAGDSTAHFPAERTADILFRLWLLRRTAWTTNHHTLRTYNGAGVFSRIREPRASPVSHRRRGFRGAGSASAHLSGQLLALIVCIMIGASGSIMAVRKDPYTRISVVTQIGNMIKFRRTQQNFRYVYKSPWEQS